MSVLSSPWWTHVLLKNDCIVQNVCWWVVFAFRIFIQYTSQLWPLLILPFTPNLRRQSKAGCHSSRLCLRRALARDLLNQNSTMADGSLRMVAAYPSPPNHSSPQHPYFSQSSEPRRKESLSALPLRYDNACANMAASSMSPLDIKSGFGGVGTAIAYGGPQSSTLSEGLNEKNSLLSGLGFTKSSAEKKLTRDGQPAKRRGPKPDSKPAMTRRQELNRQAQRYGKTSEYS